MSYTPTEWQAGDIVTATKLNNIEQGIVNATSKNWELIKEETFTNDEEADKTINTDSNGNGFELTDIILRFDLPKNENASSIGSYGKVKACVDGNERASIMVNTITRTAGADAKCAAAFFFQRNGLLFKMAQFNITHGNMGTLSFMSTTAQSSALVPVEIIDEPIGFNSVVIPKVTGICHYKLYGKRK